ncbi:hypothetical protein CAter282_2937 [Collimonas arenae]|uniref:Uncharacterized protein YyaB-like PH domain-containing protein n=1 Tax=Collimonas arenae TaxID=279058 RepID=A0A127QM41_9BURK|nr:PH domain-containing protein [Collimonas arenae]AMP00770.1 hypothetical protein CAter10_3232 [Collimonas arenae]AMP10662.1 hypothetical protein CAter282_2937 [Collimonas arenae]
MSQEFPSKIDLWLVLVLAGTVAFVISIGFSVAHTVPAAKFICFGVAALMALIVWAFCVPCKYVLEADHLLIQAGFIRQCIPYRQITHIDISSNPRSAPALSLQRVKVSFGDAYQLVSPIERERFIRMLRDKVRRAD